ncbi:hypothetical protein [Acinetobacter sp. A47]|uniref:hypothetical protein n=1 Tax=Acinetobacter sp. A47 TaxID=1561217 RepID=UPI000570DA38|nr:hypothetical protein [Acinetobacter sp. A47]
MKIKQKRDNRFNVNLTDDETQLFNIIYRLTGENIGPMLRNLALKQALAILIADDGADFNLQKILEKGAAEHLEGS